MFLIATAKIKYIHMHVSTFIWYTLENFDGKTTVNSEIFARVLFSQNFAYAKFRGNKTLQNGTITPLFSDIGKSCLSCEF